MNNLNTYVTFDQLSNIIYYLQNTNIFRLLQYVILFKYLDRRSVQQNPSERIRSKFNTAMDMCLHGHNRIIMNYGYEHIIIILYIIYIEKATADLESKYRNVCVVCLQTK